MENKMDGQVKWTWDLGNPSDEVMTQICNKTRPISRDGHNTAVSTIHTSHGDLILSV